MSLISEWSFKTSSTGSVGLGVISASGGMVRLKSPQGELVDFKYIGVGAGASAGLKLPKGINEYIKNYMPQGSFAPTDFDSYGLVIKLAGCEGSELRKEDFLGPCAFVDAGGGFIAGAGATLLLVGLPTNHPIPVPAAVVAFSKACICMTGYSMTKNFGIGASGLVGNVYI